METENCLIDYEDDKIIITNIEPGSLEAGQVHIGYDEMKEIVEDYSRYKK